MRCAFGKADALANLGLVSKTTYDYDWPQYPEHLVATPAAAVQHDETNFGPGTAAGRGNMVLKQRWDVINNTATEYKWGYYTMGTVAFARDPRGHQSNTYYADNFYGGTNHNTFAYPTQISDEDGNNTWVQYHYDMGVITTTQTPSPNAGQTAPYETMTYDAAGRLQQVTNGINGAYKQWVYSGTGLDVITHTKIQTGTDETFSDTSYDGAGRIRVTSTDNPDIVDGASAVWMIYDAMGRMTQRTNPAMISASWVPSGDDAVTGWVFTQQEYDWKGRPTVMHNPDGTTVEVSYGGCGCAGGAVTNVKDEAGRRKRTTQDVFGRLAKTEELNWDQSVYATTTYSYNALDQLTQINQSGQTRTFDYDGMGRLWHRTTPEQGAMTYTYNADDTLNVVTDARGATTTYTYNNRHLVTNIRYGVPSGVAATPSVDISYDAAGNRAWMATYYQ